MTTRTVECRYNRCGQPFTSKARMKEHVLWHLEVDPPKRVYQHALIQFRTVGGGWVVLQDLGGQEEDKGEGSSSGSGQMRSQVDSEVERFRLADILPVTTDSQAGNVTTTTTTSGGTISQSINFSPHLPDRPTQLSLPSQTSQSLSQSQCRSLPTPQRSTPSQSPLLPTHPRSRSRDPPTPFVHSAPRSGRARTTVSESPASPTSSVRHARTGSPSKKRMRVSESPFIPPGSRNKGMQVRSSTPKTAPSYLPSQSQPHTNTQTQTQSDWSQYPPASGDASSLVPLPSGQQPEVVKRTFGFGEALDPAAKVIPNIQTGVSFSFGGAGTR